MPRKHPNSVYDKSQAAITRGFTNLIKARNRAKLRKQKQVKKAADKQLVAKWRALNKYGIISTKNKPAAKNLTPNIRRKVSKEFNRVQGIGHYERGVTSHPFQIDPSSKNPKYILGKGFVFRKTKYKVKDDPSIISKSKKGVIIEQSQHQKKWIDKNGNVKTSSNNIIWTSRVYRGDEILQLYSDIKERRIKLSKKKFISWEPFGQYTTRSVDDNDLFIETIDQYVTEMHPERFRAWLDETPVHFGHSAK